MNRNLFSCVRFFDTECVACLHLGNETGKFVFATDCKYAVCFDEKRMEKVFRRFCGFIIMFKSCEIFELNNFAYVIEICYASSSRKRRCSDHVLVKSQIEITRRDFVQC